jgi:dihydrolipoamide dehydrogenase
MPHTEVAILGAGPGGYVAAIRLGQLGKKVTLIDQQWLGGVCLNVGCIPSKAVIHVAKLKHRLEKAGEMGLKVGDLKLDMVQLQKWKGDVVARLVNGVAQLERQNKVEFVKGKATLTGPHSVEVRGDGQGQTFEADHIIVATGSRPMEIPGFKIDGKRVVSSTEALEFLEVPRTLCVIGGGVIGLELGTAYAHLGSKVTVVELLDQLLPGTDPDLVRVVGKNLRAFGVEYHLKAKAQRLTEKGVEVLTEDGKTFEVPGEKVLLSVGRRPNTDDLGLDKAGVATDDRGYIKVDDQLSTNVPGIWALGDCNGKGAFTHTAYNDFAIVAANLLENDPRRVSDRIMAYALYIDPPLGRAGATEAEVRSSGRPALIATRPMTRVGRAVEKGETQGFMKILVDAESKQILGASLLGMGGDEVIHCILDLMYARAPYTVMQRAMHIHPTVSELLPTMLEELKPL